jgi:hypothetical protein
MCAAAQASAAFRFPAHSIAGRVGTSFKHEHLQAILAEGKRDRFFEVHAENYMGAGGPPHAALSQIRQDYPVSLHGVCMSIGGPQPLDKAHLQRFKGLVDRYEPALVSEHLAWSTHGSTYFNDLLPLPYTASTVTRVADHIDQVQEALGHQLLLENPSTYLIFPESTMSETSFIAELVRRTGCGLLLDINNVFVSPPTSADCSRRVRSGQPFAEKADDTRAASRPQRMASDQPARSTGKRHYRLDRPAVSHPTCRAHRARNSILAIRHQQMGRFPAIERHCGLPFQHGVQVAFAGRPILVSST